MSVLLHFEDIEAVNLDLKAISGLIVCAISEEKGIEGDINLIFCSDNYLLEMNKKYLSHDYYTDILTFDYTEAGIISGDLFISIDRVGENAENFKTGFTNELYRVIVHGILHLLGYDDKDDDEQSAMRAKEDEYLGKMGELKG